MAKVGYGCGNGNGNGNGIGNGNESTCVHTYVSAGEINIWMRANCRRSIEYAGEAADANSTCITVAKIPGPPLRRISPATNSHTWHDYVAVGLKDIASGRVPVVCRPDRHQMSTAEFCKCQYRANRDESVS